MADEHDGQSNGVGQEFDIPTITAPSKNKKDKKGGALGPGNGAGGQAASLAMRPGPLGFFFRNIGTFLKLGPIAATAVMGVVMPMINKASNDKMYQDALKKGMLMRKAAELPSDEAVRRMRESTGMDNEGLVGSANGGKGLKFGDGTDDPGAEDAANEAAKGGMDGSASAAGAKDKGAEAAAAASAGTADAMKQSAFGKGDIAGAAGGGGGGGASSGASSKGFNNNTVNFAPKSNFGQLKNAGGKGGKASGMEKVKPLGRGSDGRRFGGARGKGLAQLKMAALHSKKATTMKGYQASSAKAGQAFDGGTMAGDNASGIGGAGAGEGGAGVGDGQADVDAAEAQAKGITAPKVEAPKPPKNQACNSENKAAMKDVMEPGEYSDLEGKCNAEEKMNQAFMWLAAAAVAVIALSAMENVADALLDTPYTASAGAIMKMAVIVACLAVIAAANILAGLAAADALKYPSLKGQGAGLIFGTVVVDVGAAMAMMGKASFGSSVGMQMSNVGKGVTQGIAGGSGGGGS